MAQAPNIYVGTVGQSVWRSQDGGESWKKSSKGMFSESDIRALAADPNDPTILFAGTETGIYRSNNGGDNWEQPDSELNQRQIWSLAIDPKDSNTIFAGTCPSAFFKSEDGGDSWKQLSVELAADCGAIIPRVTTMIIDPEDSQTIYAGIEIDGMRVSHDGGETWKAVNEGLSSQDVHGLTVVPGQTKTIVAATNNDICVTTDLVSWTPLKVKEHFPWGYCRSALYVSENANRVYVGAGNGPPGDQGGLFYTSNLGETWERADLGGNSNSTIWCVVKNPAINDWIMAYSVSGQIFRSTDNGDTWKKLAREFGEVRALAIV
ncbi:MAG: photosystem II stability/assembly factor-like uncharacterized protein [Candidatus Latescibacterota bacterium]|jgi:photosystem II stability/assembly factor-like uncharacterized protein